MPALLVVLALVAMLAGSVAAVAGFGIGSLMTPVLAVAHGTKVAVILVAIPHLAATALRAGCCGGTWTVASCWPSERRAQPAA